MSLFVQLVAGLFVLAILVGIVIVLSLYLPQQPEEKVWDESASEAAKKKKIETRRKRSLFRRARQALKKGIVSSAEDLLYQASGLEEDDPTILLDLAISLQQQQKFDKARVILEKLSVIAPSERSLTLLGVVLLELGKENDDQELVQNSLACFNSVRKKYPDSADACLGMANCFEYMNEEQQAIKMLQEGFDLDPTNREVGLGLASRYERTQQTTKLKKHWERMMNRFPGDTEVLSARAEFEFAAKHYLTTFETLEYYLDKPEMLPDSTLRLLAISSYELNRYQVSRPLWQDLINRGEPLAEDYYYLGEVEEGDQHYQAARDAIQAAIDLDAEDERFHLAMAEVCLHLGDKDHARLACRRVLSLNPEHAGAQALLDKLPPSDK